MIPKIRNKLSLKIFIITSAILVVTTLITFLFFLLTASKTYIAELDSSLEKETNGLINQLNKSTYNDSGKLFDQYLSQNNAILELYNSDFEFIEIPSNITTFPDNTTLNFSGITASEGFDNKNENIINFNTITKNYEFSFSNSNDTFILAVTGTRQNFTEILNSVVLVFPYWLLVVLLISFLTGWFYSNFITKPIKWISKNSEEMIHFNFKNKCSVNRTDEIGILANNLNLLSEELSKTLEELKSKNSVLLNDLEREKHLEKQRMEFFSSISHELKTPITILRGQLEGMIQGIGVYSDQPKYLRKTLATVLSMESMVQEILTISRINSADRALNLRQVNLSALISDLCYHLEDTAASNDITIFTDIEDDVLSNLDINLMKKVITNIIINGIKYSPEGHDLFITLSSNEKQAIFTCLNTGTSIPEEYLTEIFQAFYRIESSRNKETGGTGLGLYIVKTSLDLHQIKYSLSNTKDGVLFKIYFNKL